MGDGRYALSSSTELVEGSSKEPALGPSASLRAGLRTGLSKGLFVRASYSEYN